MKTIKLIAITLLAFISYSNAKAYITVTRNNGSILGLYKTTTENRSWDRFVEDFRYTLLCSDPGWNRCRFNTFAGEAQLVTNTGGTVSGDGLDPYIAMADNQINNGTTSGTILTADGIVITWNVNAALVSTVNLYSYTEAQQLGIVQ